LPKNRRHSQLFKRQNFCGNGPEDGAEPPALDEPIHPEAGNVAEVEREVTLPMLFEILALGVAHHVVDECMGFILREGRVVEFLQVAMQANHRRLAGADVTVRGSLLDAKGQQFGDINHRGAPYELGNGVDKRA
jgi:hypothetical protein